VAARYAERTEVAPEKSRAELERILARYGASKFMYGWDENQAILSFFAEERYVRFTLSMPDRDEHRFTHHARGRRTQSAAEKEWEQATRQVWRALVLVVKAKLEAVAAGIAEFEQEFLAYIVLPDDRTVGQHVRAAIASAYQSGKAPMLALGPGSDS
jgi:hypothetical protein